MGKREPVALLLLYFMMSWDCKCSVALLLGVVGLSSVCD